jgi:hypothetical protein
VLRRGEEMQLRIKFTGIYRHAGEKYTFWYQKTTKLPQIYFDNQAVIVLLSFPCQYFSEVECAKISKKLFMICVSFIGISYI